MKIVVLALVLVSLVLVSKLVSELLPRISLPLIQIVLGFVLALFVPSFDFSFDSEVFLLVFIAPLLFDDGIGMDKFALYQLRRPIMSLAIGLVFVTTLVLGSLLHLIAPTIPLAVAYAFAAALGPTDAVAVNSLSRRIALTGRQKNLLQGEWLFNDASGIVAFQFALIFVATGTFSILSAAGTFFLEFFGGILVGVVCMLARAIIMRYVNSTGSEDSAFKVAFELITPYVIYLVAYLLHTSGIIAVVAAAIIYSLSSTRSRYDSAETATVSSNMWSLVVFVLNGVVFVMLGVLFVHTLPKVWVDPDVSNWWLLLIILATTVFLYGIRFLWLCFFKTTNSAEATIAGAMLGTVGGVVTDVGQSIVDAPSVYLSPLFKEDTGLDESLPLTPDSVVAQMDQAQATAVEAMSADGSTTSAFAAVNNLQIISAQERRDISRAFREARREMRQERWAELKARHQAKREQKKSLKSLQAQSRANKTPEQREERKRQRREQLRSNLIITLCGAKGVVTFAIVLSLPVLINDAPLPKRDMLIFLAAGVILLTLLVANFLVPRLAGKPVEELDREEKLSQAKMRIISTTIQRLTQHRTEENKEAVDQLLLEYDRRAAYLRENAHGELKGDTMASLFGHIVQLEQENTFRLIEQGKVQAFFGYSYLGTLVQVLAEMNRSPFMRDQLRAMRTWFRHYWTLTPQQRHIRRSDEADLEDMPSLKDILLDYPATRRAQLRRIRHLNEENLADRLEAYVEENMDLGEEEKELALRQAQLYRHRVTLDVVTPNRPSLDAQGEEAALRLDEQREELRMWALQQERNEVHRLYEADVIDIDIMRDLMHDISLRQIESSE